jgi:multiple sugar transport system ATP-binding protein
MFLFDEPLSNLDAALRVEMRVELAKIKSQLNTTVVYVTHDQVEAMTLADKIVVLRDGRVEQTGRPLDLYARPANLFVAGFIGSPKMNFLAAVSGLQSGNALSLRLQDGSQVDAICAQALPAGTQLTLGIRPEHLSVTRAGQGSMDGKVVVAERLGGETYFHIRVTDKIIVAKVNGDSDIGVGAMVGLQFNSEQAHLFLADGQRAG